MHMRFVAIYILMHVNKDPSSCDDVLIETKFMRKARPRGLDNGVLTGIAEPDEKKIRIAL